MFACDICSQECGGHPDCPECKAREDFLLAVEPEYKTWYIHKHEVALQYGGPEEGGWWYDAGSPDEEWVPAAHAFNSEDEAYAVCRGLNEMEQIRAKQEEDYEYTSVLAYKSSHYAYTVEDHPNPYFYPDRRPHYE